MDAEAADLLRLLASGASTGLLVERLVKAAAVSCRWAVLHARTRPSSLTLLAHQGAPAAVTEAFAVLPVGPSSGFVAGMAAASGHVVRGSLEQPGLLLAGQLVSCPAGTGGPPRAVLTCCLDRGPRDHERLIERLQFLADVAAVVVERGEVDAEHGPRSRRAVAHELLGLLGTLTLDVERLGRALGTHDAAHLPKSIGHVDDSLQRIRDVIDGSLLGRTARRSHFSLSDITRETLKLMSGQLEQDEVHWHVHSSADAIVSADPTELRLVVRNLLSNAQRAVAERFPEDRHLSVSCTASGDRVRLEVSDSGFGIPAELMPRIFEPNVTGYAARGGMGVGLAVSRDIARRHGGDITAANLPDGGARFVVTLPLAADASRERITPLPLTAALDVLLIDDDVLFCRAVQRSLSDRVGIRYITRATEALEVLRKTDPDVVFCDVMLPGAAGTELFSTATRRAPHLASRFVFLSGGTLTGPQQQARAATERPILYKPVTSTELLRAIRQVAIGGTAAPAAAPG